MRCLQGLQGQRWRATFGLVMTAKEKLRIVVEELSESEAESAPGYIGSCRHGELGEQLDSAPVHDEPSTPEEQAAVQAAREELARGETVNLDEIRSEFASATPGASRPRQPALH